VLYSTIRLEFNQSHLDYYTELDAVCLEGVRCHSEDFQQLPSIHVQSTAGESDTKLSHSDSSLRQYVQIGASVTVREYLTPMDILSRGFARLHLQNGLTAALDVSDNGYFDLLPVGGATRTFFDICFCHYSCSKYWDIMIVTLIVSTIIFLPE